MPGLVTCAAPKPGRLARVVLGLLDLFLRSQQDQRIGVHTSPLAERHDVGIGDEGNRFTFTRAADGRPLGLIRRVPQTLGLAIVDQEHILVDVAANTELVALAVSLAPVNHGQLSQRSPRHRHRFAADPVVNHLMAVK